MAGLQISLGLRSRDQERPGKPVSSMRKQTAIEKRSPNPIVGVPLLSKSVIGSYLKVTKHKL